MRIHVWTATLAILVGTAGAAEGYNGESEEAKEPASVLPSSAKESQDKQDAKTKGKEPMSSPGCCPPPVSRAPRVPDGAPSEEPATVLTPPESALLSAREAAFPAHPGGYIDNAIPRTRFTFRFDAAYDNVRPDRAEFFYGKCGCFREAGADPNAPGPPEIETSVDYQDFWFQFEYKFLDRGSAFLEVPVRLVNPEQNANTGGFGDLQAGFKYALIAEPDNYFTAQLRVYAPTGEADRGLGTDHTSLEPALLYYRELNSRTILFGELRDWIPVGGSGGNTNPNFGATDDDFAGNVLRYGLGVGYEAYRSPQRGYNVMPVLEFVGWSVLDGLATKPNGRVEDASDDTIVNAKIGVRLGFDGFQTVDVLSSRRNSLYVGYGRALTGDTWYDDIFRVAYRMNY